jgi:hypothetical protein
MAVSQDVFDQAMEQLKNTALSAKTPDVPVATSDAKVAERGGSVMGSVAQNAADVGAATVKGIQSGDEFLKALIYNVARPVIPETGKAGELVGRALRPIDVGSNIEERAARPKTVTGKVLGPAAQGVGAMLTMPIVGPESALVNAARPSIDLARTVIAGMGMGEGAELGKQFLGGLFSYFNGPQARPMGEAVGSLVGGGVGGQLNVTRFNAMGQALKTPFEVAKNIGPAFKSAMAKNALLAKDEKNLWGIFADEMGNLRSTTKGIIADFTQRNIASAIRKDIRASTEAEQFVADAQKTGIYQRPWGLAERTMVPTLTETVAKAKPESYAQGVELQERAQKMQRAITFAYNRMVKGANLPANQQGIEASAKAMQAMTQSKVDALSNEAGQVKNNFRRLDATQEAALGDATRVARDKLRDEAYARGSALYENAEVFAGENRAIVSPEEVRTEGAKILHEFYSKVRPEEVPPVVRNMLSATKVETKTTGGLVLPEDIAAEKEAAAAAKEAAGKPMTLKEANDLYKAFGEAAETARMSENNVAAKTARALQEKVRSSIEKSALPDEAKMAWDKAVENWRTDYSERFQEGIGKALGKERGGAVKGREVIPDEKVIDNALAGPTPMREWETTFKGNLNADAALRVGLEDRFRKQVMDKAFNAERFESSVDSFKEKYAAGLDKFPEVRDKIDRESAKLLVLENEKKMELDRYKDLMKSDVTKSIGPVQAKQFFEAILADPVKMEQAIKLNGVTPKKLVKEIFEHANPFQAGEYNPEAVLQLAESGKGIKGSKSSMELLLESAFGPEQGKQHLDTIEAIARFTKRQMATEPRELQATSILNESPVLKATGQRTASWIAAIRASWAGNTSSTYVGALGLSRFANAKVQAAVEKAKRQALYDPETAKAILEMAGKDSTEALSLTTAKKIFGDLRLADGQRVIDKMIDKGYVQKHIGRGIIYGMEKIEQDAEDPKNRSTARRSP